MQTELFEISAPLPAIETETTPKPSVLEKTFLTLRLDQTIGLVLVLLVFFVVCYSWGVEQGKHWVRNEQVIRVTPKAETPALPEGLTLIDDAAPVTSRPDASPAAVVTQATSVPVVTPADAGKTPGKNSVKPSGKYTIQHVIYVTRSAADREVQKLTQKGQTAFVVPSGKYLQVCVAGFQTKKEADRYMRQLRSQRIVSGDSYIRPMPA